MDKYRVMISPKAYRDLDSIYGYIADTLLEAGTAEKIAARLEDAILSLDELPYRGAERQTGVYANKGYRQLFVGSYTRQGNLEYSAALY